MSEPLNGDEENGSKNAIIFSGSRSGNSRGVRERYPTFPQNARTYFTEYCNKSTLPGVVYLGERKRTILERLWWIITFVICISICLPLVTKLYRKLNEAPAMLNVVHSPTPIWKIPFPAVTICTETKAKQRIYNFTAAYHKIVTDSELATEDELRKFERIALVCDNHLYGKGNKTVDLDTIQFLSKVAPSLPETMWMCKWSNTNTSCTDLFTTVLTEEGVCFTFNMLDQDEFFTNRVFRNLEIPNAKRSNGWSLEKGYTKTEGIHTFPKRAISAGQGAGLSFVLHASRPDLDYICRGPVQGFKVLLHHPAEVPRVSQKYFRAPLNQEVVFSITPEMMVTSKNLKSHEPNKRQCYFSGERKLNYFQTYSERNCEIECLANHTLIKCGCVAYHMPHEESTPICGSGSIVCMHEAHVELVEKDARMSIENYEKGSNRAPHRACGCLPACTSLNYNAEISQADYNWPKVLESFKADFEEYPGVQMTRVTLFFKDKDFLAIERTEWHYGKTEFLAACGGLLALFLGFSLISLVEMIYFVSLRLWINICLYGQEYWAGKTTNTVINS